MKEQGDGLFFGLLTIRNSRISYIKKQAGVALALLAASWVGPQALAQPGTGEDMIVQASGFKHDRGQAIASVFREGQDIFKKPHLRVQADIDQGKATLVFPQMEYGNYAVIVFHDENGNNDLDHNLLRFPAEPLGYSNGFRFTLFSGMPKFEKLQFSFGAHARPIEVVVE